MQTDTWTNRTALICRVFVTQPHQNLASTQHTHRVAGMGGRAMADKMVSIYRVLIVLEAGRLMNGGGVRGLELLLLECMICLLATRKYVWIHVRQWMKQTVFTGEKYR